MKNLNTLFYDNKHLLALTIMVLIAAGVSSLVTLPRMEDPRIENRFAVVITRFPGASAERVEALVSDKIETELREIAEIDTLTSTSRAGVSIVSIELADWVSEPEAVWAKVRSKVDDAESRLPQGVLPTEFDDKRAPAAYTLIVGIKPHEGSNTPLQVAARYAEELADQLRNVNGTELVRLYGEPSEEISVTVDSNELAALGLNAYDLAALVSSADAKGPAGMLRGGAEALLEVDGAIDEIARVASVPLAQSPGQGMVRLGDIADIQKDIQAPPRSMARIKGERGVFVAARMLEGRRVDQWSDEAIQAFNEFRERYQSSVDVSILFDQSQYTHERIQSLAMNLVMGAGVVAFIIFLMMGWRSAIVVGSALPFCAAAVLFGLVVFEIPIHQMSIFGMIIALGLLIDNAIVIVDEINKRLQRGAEPRQAIAESIRHLFGPLLGSTLTTVIAFMPILLLYGNIGEFIGSIAASVIMALIASFILSMTVIASLAGLLGRPGRAGQSRWLSDGIQWPWLSRGVHNALSVLYRRPLLAIFIALALPIAGFMRIPELGNQFFPAADRDHFHIQMWLAAETPIKATYELTGRVDQAIDELEPGAETWWSVGQSVPKVYYNMLNDMDDSDHYAQAVVQLESYEQVKRFIPRLQAGLDRRFPQARIVVRKLGQGPPVDAPVELRLVGHGLGELKRLGEEIRTQLHTLPETLHSSAQISGGELKYWIDADEDQARLAGMSLRDIGAQMQVNLEGGVGGSMLEESEELPVRVRYSNAVRGDVSEIASMQLTGPQGAAWLPLAALGAMRLAPETSAVTRRDGLRTNAVKAYLRDGALPPETTERLLDRLDRSGFSLPPGYRLEIGGDAEAQQESISKLLQYTPVLAVLMAAALVLSFRSFAAAGLLGVVAGASAGLACLVIWVSGYPFGFNPTIGTAGLIGVALNDSIVVLASIRSRAASAQGEITAVVEQVMDCSRHLISTTLTTIGGFLPLLIFTGGDFWPPLAVVIAGGVAGATLMAFLFVPAAYILWTKFAE